MRQREVSYTGPKTRGTGTGPVEPAGVFACGGICQNRAYLLKFHLLEAIATMSNFRCFIIIIFLVVSPGKHSQIHFCSISCIQNQLTEKETLSNFIIR